MIGLTPDITAVVVIDHGVLRLTFADGVSGEVAVLERMRGPVSTSGLTSAGLRLASAKGSARASLSPPSALWR